MLDSHPNVWGMGEDSIFNGNLPKLRDEMVAASESRGLSAVDEVIRQNAEFTIRTMKNRAKNHFLQNPELHGNRTIKSVTKITDKMLFNYKNLGTYLRVLLPLILLYILELL
jgi:DNA polymerase III alpha subunit (gram-positive type)